MSVIKKMRGTKQEELEFFDAMSEESDIQDVKFPSQWVKPDRYLALAILVEEVGELARSMLTGNLEEARQESVQVATVAMRIHQFLMRQKPPREGRFPSRPLGLALQLQDTSQRHYGKLLGIGNWATGARIRQMRRPAASAMCTIVWIVRFCPPRIALLTNAMLLPMSCASLVRDRPVLSMCVSS